MAVAGGTFSRILSPLQGVWGGLARFPKALSRTKAGLIGFIGLVFYALLITVGQALVPFDGKVKLDQIAAPPGSRLQLLTRAEDADAFTSLAALAGRTVGVVGNTGGPDLVRPYSDSLEVDETRWRSGRGIPEALEKLEGGDIDALVLFSETVKRQVTRPGNLAYPGLAIANPALGPPHLLGTDTQGRDILSHIVNGGRTLIVTALLAGLISTVIAVVLGALAALLGGVVDRVFTALANFILVIPRFPLLVVLAALIQLNNFVLLATLIGVLSWPALMRAVRSQVLSLRERDYVEAAIALDLSRGHIIGREILPNMISFVVVNLIFAVTSAMYEQVGLIFLGMAPINDYTWGVMLYFGRTRGTLFSPDSASMVLAPVFAIVFFQVSMVMFASAMEEVFDPRLRSS
ncbi:MAG: ABC transporter permease subunit [Deinococcota bacterium]|jgi:peptide/nickel transport system permease protein|nr:ABC transporter permease subunit [Deinococcota bacterium]